jgi:hypothetical protein
MVLDRLKRAQFDPKEYSMSVRPRIRRMEINPLAVALDRLFSASECEYSAPRPKAVPAPAKPAAPGQKFLDAFGDEGGVWFAQGKTFAEAQAICVAELKAESAKLAAETDELQRKLASPGTQEALRKHLGSAGLAKFAAGLKFKNRSK